MVTTAEPERLDGVRVARRRPFAGLRYPIVVALVSRLFTFVLVGVVGLATAEPGAGRMQAMLAPFGMWDGVWYRRLAEFGYDPTLAHGNGAAFFPLYPSLIGAVEWMAPVGGIVAGVLLSTTLFLIAIPLLYRLTERRFGEAIARRSIWYIAFFPTAFAFSAVYTESLFLLTTVAAFALLEAGRIARASVAGMLATLTRPTGIMLAPAFAFRLWKDNGRRLDRRLLVRLSPLALLPLAYIGFGVYLYLRTGDPLATQSAQRDGWGRGADLLLVLGLPIAVFHGLARFVADPSRATYVWDTLCAMVWTLLLVEGALRRRVPGEYLLYAALAVLLPALAGSYLAFPRYGMGVFVLFWLIAIHARRPWLDRTLKVAFPIGMVVLVILTYGAETYTP
jgi:hypothetical protein